MTSLEDDLRAVLAERTARPVLDPDATTGVRRRIHRTRRLRVAVRQPAAARRRVREVPRSDRGARPSRRRHQRRKAAQGWSVRVLSGLPTAAGGAVPEPTALPADPRLRRSSLISVSPSADAVNATGEPSHSLTVPRRPIEIVVHCLGLGSVQDNLTTSSRTAGRRPLAAARAAGLLTADDARAPGRRPGGARPVLPAVAARVATGRSDGVRAPVFAFVAAHTSVARLDAHDAGGRQIAGTRVRPADLR